MSIKLVLSVIAAILVVPSLAAAEPPAGPMAATSTTPGPVKSIVLVHGAFADGSSWDKVIPALQDKGYRVVAVHEPMTSVADDVAAVKRAIDSVPGPVLLVGHSYGGVLISEAGAHEKVAGLVYIAAFAPGDKESINDLLKGQTPPPWISALEVDSGGYARLPEANVLEDFVPDLPKAEARIVAAKQGPVSPRVFDKPISGAAWKVKPTWYLRAEQDKIVPPAGQAAWAKRMGAKTTTIKSGHVPMLSQPREVTKVILAAATAPAKESAKQSAQR